MAADPGNFKNIVTWQSLGTFETSTQNFDFTHHLMHMVFVWTCGKLLLQNWQKFSGLNCSGYHNSVFTTLFLILYCIGLNILSSHSKVDFSHSNMRKFHQLYQACVSHHSFHLGSWPLTSTLISQQISTRCVVSDLLYLPCT